MSKNDVKKPIYAGVVVVFCTASVAGFCGTEGPVDLVEAERGRFRMQPMPGGVQVSKLNKQNRTTGFISTEVRSIPQ